MRTFSRRAMLTGAAAVATAGCVTTPNAQPQAPLAAAGRPRLLVTPEMLATLEQRLGADATGRAWRAALLREADRLGSQPPVERRMEARRTVLLPTSREVLRRVEALGAAWLIRREPRDATRLAAEITRVCSWADWNPGHFLDVAEMATAIALAVDWCQDGLPDAVRRQALGTLVSHALLPAVEEHDRRRSWTRATHNWSLVCNGGMVLAAIAAFDHAPALCQRVIELSLAAVRPAFASYGPDGGWDEGVSYWDYATQYAVFLVAGLESAYGTSFGLADTPGFANTALFRLQLEAPSGRVVNFADGAERVRHTPALMWLAGRFQQPHAAWIAARTPNSHGTGVLWYQPHGRKPEGLARAVRFRRAEVACLRSRWDDPKAAFIALKAGDNGANHSNLDIGSVVVELGGERFALDLGPDDYALPGYFNRQQRYSYYRTGTAGQNTLLLDGQNQPAAAKAVLGAVGEHHGVAIALADLSPAYPAARAVQRGVAVLDDASVVIADELNCNGMLDWRIHTSAEIQVAGAEAHLTLNGTTVRAVILDPPEAVFTIGSAARPPPEAPNTGIRRLDIRQPITGEARLTVLLTLGPVDERRTRLARRPLAAWV